jgi:hypothetical protein
VPTPDPSLDAAVTALAARIRAHLADPANRRPVVELLTGDGPEARRLRRLAQAQADLDGLRLVVEWDDPED